MKQPHELHWKAAKRILQYIQGTRSYDIHYAADSELELVGDLDLCKNTTEYTNNHRNKYAAEITLNFINQ